MQGEGVSRCGCRVPVAPAWQRPVLVPGGHRLEPTGSGVRWTPFRTDRAGRRDPVDETNAADGDLDQQDA